jgi:hypothetical protein
MELAPLLRANLNIEIPFLDNRGTYESGDYIRQLFHNRLPGDAQITLPPLRTFSLFPFNRFCSLSAFLFLLYEDIFQMVALERVH